MNEEKSSTKRSFGLALLIFGGIWLGRFTAALIFYLMGKADEETWMGQPLFLVTMILIGAVIAWFGQGLRNRPPANNP